MRILIYGAPGAGKTTASKLLHNKTDVELYEGDYLREVKLPSKLGVSDDPFLYIGTKQAWRHFGALTSQNVVKGLLAVRNSMRPYIDEELAAHADVIFEAAFLDPTHYPEDNLYLVVTSDEEQHREQFFKDRKFFMHRQRNKELEEGFKASRLIQAYLLEEAKKLKVTVIHNVADPAALLAQFEVN